MPGNTHHLKTWPEPFAAVRSGFKRFELRKDDRGFKVGDELYLLEYDPKQERYHGGEPIRARVTYIARAPAFGLTDDMCVMSIEVQR